jgi:transposase
LELLLYPSAITALDPTLPDFEYVHKELSKKGVTLQRLWEEYSENRLGYSYSRFCFLYHNWKSCETASMIQTHKAGENTFIDYSGLTIPIQDPCTGNELFSAQIFVASLGASSYTFCEATKSQKSEDWIASHQRMSAYFEGVTECWVPDNLKAGVTCADRYEPEINRTYLELSQHYETCIVPARARKPKDKSKAEGAVYLVETQVLAALRNRTFFSLEELNDAIKPLLKALNEKPFQKMPGSSRYSLYLELDKPALQSLPATPYELFHWGKLKVDPSYHIIIEEVPYSVPYRYIKKMIEFRYNDNVVEVFFKGKRIALHNKSLEKRVPVTEDQHRPRKHRYQAKCTTEEIRKQAQEIGITTLEWVDRVLEDSSIYPKQRINTTLGVVRLNKSYSKERLNAACARGLFYENFRARSIRDILKRDLDKEPLPKQETITALPQGHKNVRGPAYYQ